jgi:hypothetical protein
MSTGRGINAKDKKCTENMAKSRENTIWKARCR